jgi:hypothetical protein
VVDDECLIVELQLISLCALVQPVEEVLVSFVGSRGYSGLVLDCLSHVLEVFEPLDVNVDCGHGS